MPITPDFYRLTIRPLHRENIEHRLRSVIKKILRSADFELIEIVPVSLAMRKAIEDYLAGVNGASDEV